MNYDIERYGMLYSSRCLALSCAIKNYSYRTARPANSSNGTWCRYDLGMSDKTGLHRERERRITTYFRMWVSRDFAHFDDMFAQHCRYEECTGAVYEGLGELHRWVDVMLARQRVSNWGIHEFIHAEGDCVIVVWTFEGREKISYIFGGVSIIHFNEQGFIDHVREYQAEHKKERPFLHP